MISNNGRELETLTPDVPTPEIPEFFPGFNQSVGRERERLSRAQQTLTRMEPQEGALVTSIANLPGRSRFSGLARFLQPDPAVSQLIFGFESASNQRIREEAERQVQQLALLMDAELEEIRSSSWRLNLLNLLPVWLQKGDVHTISDVLAKVPVANASQSDLNFLNRNFDALKPVMGRVVLEAGKEVTSARAKEIISRFQSKTGSFKRFHSIDPDRQTTQEILALIGQTQRFEAPDISREELAAALSEAAISDVDLEKEFEDVDAEIERLSQRWREEEIKIAGWREDMDKLIRGDITSQIEQAKLLRAATQPAILFMKPIEYWMNRIARPIAGHITETSMDWGDWLFGEDENSFRRAMVQARAEGANSWDAHRIAFEEWDTNWVLKLGIEVLADPLTYFGFGLYTKAFAGLPYIGRIVGIREIVPLTGLAKGVAVVETGYVRAAELFFRGLRQGWLNIAPKTLSQSATIHGAHAFSLAREYLERIPELGGRSIGSIRPHEVREWMQVAIVNAIQNPQSPSIGVRVGRYLLGHRAVSRVEIQQLIDDIGAGSVELNTSLMDNIQSVLETTDGFGITKFLRPNEAAPLILRSMGLLDSNPNLLAAHSFLERIKVNMQNRAIRTLDGDNTIQIMKNISDRARDNLLSMRSLEISNKRFQSGIYARMLQNVEAGTKLVWLDVIDKHFVLPFARAYLLFSFYSPMNVIENAVKTSLAGVNIFWRGNPFRRAGSYFHGIRGNVPIEILDETPFVLQLEFPEASTKLLSSGVRLTKAQRNEATEDLRSWVEKIVAPRWLKSVSGFNWGARVGGKQKTNYYIGMHKRLVTEAAPDTVDATDRVVSAATAPLEGRMDREWLEAFREELNERLLTGDLRHVRRLQEEFTLDRISTSDVAKQLDDMNLVIPELGDLLLQKSLTGELYSGGAKGVSAFFHDTMEEAAYQYFMETPQFFRARFSDMLGDFMAWNPVSIEELHYKINAIDQIVTAFGDQVHVAMSAAQAYAERLTNPVVKGVFYDDFWNVRITPHLRQGGDEIAQLILDAKSKLQTSEVLLNMSRADQELYLSLLDNDLARVARTRWAREEQRRIEQLWTQPGGQFYVAPRDRAKTPGWWDDFLDARRVPYQQMEDQVLGDIQKNAAIKTRLSGIILPTPVDASQRPLVVEDIAKLFGTTSPDLHKSLFIPDLIALRGRRNFITTVKARAQDGAGAARPGAKAEDFGFNEEAIGRIYDQITRKFYGELSAGAHRNAIEPILIQLETLRERIIGLGASRKAMMPDEAVSDMRAVIDNIIGPEGISTPELVETAPRRFVRREKSVLSRTASTYGLDSESRISLERLVTDDWQKVREDTLIETRKRFFQDFPDYENQTAFSAFAKTIFPYWGYEAHRWFWWLPREFIRHPGVYAGWGKYENNTNQGYTHIPGTDLDINPIRGTIFMGGMRRLFMRDFPEFYDALGPVAEHADTLGRWGFFPGAHYGLVASTFGSKMGKPQWGQMLPASGRTVLTSLMAIDTEHTGRILQRIFPDNFRDFQIGSMAGQLGADGMVLFEKRVTGQPFTDEEQAQWDRGVRATGKYGALMEQTGMMRIMPEDKVEFFDASLELMHKLTGLPKADLVDLRKHGIRVEDVFGPLPPEVHKQVAMLEGFMRFSGGAVLLLPSELGRMQAVMREYWREVDNKRQVLKQERLSMEASLRVGTNDIRDWLFTYRETKQRLAEFIEDTRATDRYKDVPMTLEEKTLWAEENKMLPPVFSPQEELQAIYFERELEDKFNPATGQIEPDFDAFFLWREMIEQALPEDQRESFIGYLQEDYTPLERTYYEVNKDFFRPYARAFDAVISDFVPEEQQLLHEYRSANSTRREEIRGIISEVPGGDNRKLVSLFEEKLRIFHENMRENDPELDAWLNIFKFQGVSSFKTDIAQTIHNRLLVELGFPLG